MAKVIETTEPFMCETCDAIVNPFLYMGDFGPVYRELPASSTRCYGCTTVEKFREENN